ncbi:hypothetical protein [Carboxylicivirga caseinilyticus]|uniref:hypothetical protein n=1 Tax=Carboxylicivirga caseinilyticus TaxID=3417572 RepID=UPI002AA8AFD5|nr:hypothetical protein [uncultured Carboxylicivirga sp.]MCU4163681.1 hypothetical protein [Marinilabiliaceae bacterium A049]
MKIGFPAAGASGELQLFLSDDFTKCGLMGLYDTQTGNVEVIDRTDIKDLSEWVRFQKIKAIITPDIQVMALKVFKEMGISVYKAIGTMLTFNVDLMYHKALPPFQSSEMMTEGGASCSPSSCSSCSSTSCK